MSPNARQILDRVGSWRQEDVDELAEIACGAIEAWLGIEMMREGTFVPTINLDVVDDRCAPLDYVMGEPRRIETEYLMSNNFAFGGINTSLVFRRC